MVVVVVEVGVVVGVVVEVGVGVVVEVGVGVVVEVVKEAFVHRSVIAGRILELLESQELSSKCLDNDEERIYVAEALTNLFYCDACEAPLNRSEVNYGTCRDCANWIAEQEN